jgi:hypothetical protein
LGIADETAVVDDKAASDAAEFKCVNCHPHCPPSCVKPTPPHYNHHHHPYHCPTCPPRPTCPTCPTQTHLPHLSTSNYLSTSTHLPSSPLPNLSYLPHTSPLPHLPNQATLSHLSYHSYPSYQASLYHLPDKASLPQTSPHSDRSLPGCGYRHRQVKKEDRIRRPNESGSSSSNDVLGRFYSVHCSVIRFVCFNYFWFLFWSLWGFYRVGQ